MLITQQRSLPIFNYLWWPIHVTTVNYSVNQWINQSLWLVIFQWGVVPPRSEIRVSLRQTMTSSLASCPTVFPPRCRSFVDQRNLRGRFGFYEVNASTWPSSISPLGTCPWRARTPPLLVTSMLSFKKRTPFPVQTSAELEKSKVYTCTLPLETVSRSFLNHARSTALTTSSSDTTVSEKQTKGQMDTQASRQTLGWTDIDWQIDGGPNACTHTHSRVHKAGRTHRQIHIRTDRLHDRQTDRYRNTHACI